MGLLKESRVLSWEEIVKRKEEIKREGIKQFIDAYRTHKDRQVPCIAFGDELEVIMAGKEGDNWRLILGSREVVKSLQLRGLAIEYANYMLEIAAEVPYNPTSVLQVEEVNQKKLSIMTEYVEKKSGEGRIFLLPIFPNVCERFLSRGITRKLTDGLTIDDFHYDVTQSDTFPDEAITNHNRFRYFTENIRNRKGGKIEGYVLVMKDPDNIAADAAGDECIKIDSMGHGMGCCGLQTTVQARNLDEARYVYDMLAVLCPLFLRITAGSPVAMGKLLNTETRWDMVCMSVDCRTNEERGREFDVSGYPVCERPPTATIYKSRFSSIDLFLANEKANLEEYNDLNPPLHAPSYDLLKEEGVDERMAKHLASLFIRDPILSYERDDTEKNRNDFENIQSSNWRSMRLKLPEGDNKCLSGFKIETRTMEMQATTYENAAFVYFNFLASRMIVEYKPNFYIPLSLVDENFVRANLYVREKKEYFQKLGEDKQLFFYRVNILDDGPPKIKEGTISEIIGGNENFCGVMSLIRRVIKEKFDDSTKLHAYMDFVEKKAKGVYMTYGDWMRRFVFTHKCYKNDSSVNDNIVNDLLDRLVTICQENKVDYLLNEEPATCC